MANNVNNNLGIIQISEEGQAVWDGIMSRIDDLKYGHLTGLFYEADSDGRWIVPEGVYAGDAVGAKWAYRTDCDDTFINIESAWGPVLPLAEWIAQEIGKVDPDVKMVMTYEDEFPNFIGVATFTADGIDIDNDIDAEDLQEYLFDKNPELREMWDEDECDWKEDREDEAQDIMLDIQWESYDDWQTENTEWSTQ